MLRLGFRIGCQDWVVGQVLGSSPALGVRVGSQIGSQGCISNRESRLGVEVGCRGQKLGQVLGRKSVSVIKSRFGFRS